ncbi:MAG: CTP-dependent riboflavin kinase [Nanoarchaeota archaeon]|nr:CTP-dependent riboflavin kinase [Nanoarchaeota archaeon]
MQSLKGKLFSGNKKGAAYIRVYSSKLKKILGYEPFPGTLNLRADIPEIKEFLSHIRSTRIEQFEEEDDYFCNVDVYPIYIKDEKAAIVIPEATDHGSDVLEIVAPVDLREKFKLDDGDIVEITDESSDETTQS